MKHARLTMLSGAVLIGVIAMALILTFSSGTSAESQSDPTETAQKNGTPIDAIGSVAPQIDPSDPVAAKIDALALEYTRENGSIVSGEPQILLSRPVTAEDLREAGIPGPNYSPTCLFPMYLVILKGDFDVSGSIPPLTTVYAPDPSTYIADIYSADTQIFIGMAGDKTGAMFKKILGDPTPPDSRTLPQPNQRTGAQSPYAPDSVTTQQYVPCTN